MLINEIPIEVRKIKGVTKVLFRKYLIVAITQIGNNFGYLHRLHFSAWHYFCYAIY
jgi:hypothetical protein